MKNIKLPKVIFGTSGLGNLYVAKSDMQKLAIVEECINCSAKPVVFDTAGKYGAGLALESLGKSLKALNTPPDDVLISNKLGWLRTELTTPEPTFEPGVWKDLQFDAVQKISYDGILECYEQGNQLLNGYKAALVSVHDPDEYIAKGKTQDELNHLYQDVLAAYNALAELKRQGKVKAIGIGSKDWRVIQKVSQDIQLDWVMIANSLTVHSHPAELVQFMETLKKQGVAIINSAVFNGGFLIGSDYYNYQPVSRESHAGLYQWRDAFNEICQTYRITPAQACATFGLNAPGVTSIALNTTNPDRVAANVAMANVEIPPGFWKTLQNQGLIDPAYTYL
ncbi:D-threo-aldose 1-dehydrogenase [Mucilaginibacter gracilis]|uniref:D-threo-aldose 1-dehydrogenase n=1 Tax=Mucilaginibacter gracilis TaxID=423350 RepID=A0A495J7Z2_9SPHI|nr:aldo/keto reductase [Mucilaginibacter gracilis]RKR85106.1 D-threo-aldose 1-dehydrogenase [Mucilaginibacter gracilis]